MIDAGCVGAVALVAAIVSAVSIIGGMFAFENGELIRKEIETEWQGAWKALLPVSFCLAVAAGLFELLFYGATCSWAISWEVAASATLVCLWSDIKDRVIPNRVVIAVAVAAVALFLARGLVDGAPWNAIALSAVAGCVLGGGVFFVSRFITRGGVGYGDVKLFAALGLLLGFQALFNVLLYSLIAAFVYAIFLLVTRKGKINDRLPLGPFAFIGVLVSIGFGV